MVGQVNGAGFFVCTLKFKVDLINVIGCSDMTNAKNGHRSRFSSQRTDQTNQIIQYDFF